MSDSLPKKFLRSLLLTLCLTTAARADLALQRKDFASASRLAEQGKDWSQFANSLATYPLLPWLEYQRLMAAAHPDSERIEAYVRQYGDSYPADALRAVLADRYAQVGRWKDLLALDFRHSDTDTRCRIAQARIESGEQSPELKQTTRGLWLHPGSLPGACNPVFAWMRSNGQLGAALTWERIGLSALNGQASFARQLALPLSVAERLAVQHMAELLNDPLLARRHFKSWPDDAAHRRALSYAVARIARRDHALAASLWQELTPRFHFRVEARARMLDAIALYRANAYEADAADWLKLIPATRDSALSREWRVREALSRRDFSAALQALDRLDASQQGEPRWRYWRARMLDENGAGSAAAAVWRELATSPSFHGFLGADHLQSPYSLCAIATPKADLKTLLARYPGLLQALEFRTLGMTRQARRQWDYLLARLQGEDRRAVVAIADQQAWFDRAPFALTAPADQALYELRFPLAYRSEIETLAQRLQLDPAYVLGLIRSESAWVEDARSGANAYGLMQLILPTARRVAALEGVRVNNSNALLDPALNLRLGSRQLAEEGKRFQQSPWLVAAAYNAGPHRVKAWLAARGQLPTDLFIETMPFKETREYVARVLAFTPIYDWRLHGSMLPLSLRLPAVGTAYAVAGANASRRAVQCPSAVVIAPAAAPAGTTSAQQR